MQEEKGEEEMKCDKCGNEVFFRKYDREDLMAKPGWACARCGEIKEEEE